MSDASAVTTAHSRNAPCPCGSGRRYKECHGSIARVTQGTAAAPSLMQVALGAQQAGRFGEAAELYAQVLAGDPSNFDALHMLGVVHYQRGWFDDAARLLKRAVALRPDVPAARSNLHLVESVPRIERELCQEALRRAARLVEPVDDLRSLAASTSTVRLVIAQEMTAPDAAAFGRLLRIFAAARVEVGADPIAISRIPAAPGLRLEHGMYSVGGLLVVIGSAHSLRDWVEAACPDCIVLVVTADEPGDLLDRIRELSRDGKDRIGIIFATAALASRIPLPGETLALEPPDSTVLRS